MLATAGVDVLYLVVSLANKGKTMQQVGNQMNHRSMGYLATKIWYIQCAMDSAPVTGQAGEKNRLLAVEIIYLTLMLLDKLIHFMCLEKAGCFFCGTPSFSFESNACLYKYKCVALSYFCLGEPWGLCDSTEKHY